MANKEKIDELLSDIRDLEKLVAGVRNEEVYSASFFSRTFDLSHKIINNLHLVETEQLEALRRQMVEHKRLIESIPASKPQEQPLVYSAPVKTETVVSSMEKPEIEPEPEKVKPEESVPPLLVEEEMQEKGEEVADSVIEEKPVAPELPVTEETPSEEEECPAVEEAIQEDEVPAIEETVAAAEEELPVVEEMPPLPNFPELPKEEEKKDIPSVPAAELTVEEMFYAAKGEKPPVVSNAVSLNDVLEKKNLADFRKALSLNDRFRFRRELFGESEAKMNKVIAELNDLDSYKDSVNYLENELKWDLEDPTVVDFVKLLEKRFL